MIVQQEVSALEEGNPVRELADVTGAGIVVTGSYSRLGDSLRFRAEISDPRRMKVQHTVPPVSMLSVSPEAAFNELGERIAGALAVMLDTVFGESVSRSLRQPSFAAYREYVTGIDLTRRGRWDEAIQHLERAYEIDTSFVRALISAAISHGNRGRYEEADSVMEMVEQRRDRLSDYEQRFLTQERADLEGNHLEAWEVSCELAEEHRNFSYACGLYALLANRPRETIEALERIDPTKGLMKEWVYYWEVLTVARHMLGDHDRELRDAQRGGEQHPDRREAFSYETTALAALGRVEEVRVLLDELLGVPPDPSWGHAEAAAVAGLEFRAHGYPDAAREVLQLALDRLHTYLPDDDQRRNHQHNVGRTLYWSGQWEEAREIFLQLVAEDSNSVDYFGHLGVVQARLGNIEEASRISDELAALDRPYLYGANTEWQARIAAALGNREQAVELERRAFNEGLPYSIWLHRYPEFESLRDYPPFQELMRPKG
jgi:tetratricopeptide (TPR) repeat protein